MISFESDYIAGAHPSILNRMLETNMEGLPGYGVDKYCESAKRKIKDACKCPDAEVHFTVGGTQTNQLVISTMLGAYEGVIAAKTGHVSLHEAGAIEYSGHKVLEIEGHGGKLCANDVKNYIEGFYADDNFEHMVFPGMVYISYPTEYGTLYSRQELESLYEVCRSFDIPLYVDGARLGYGLASPACDITMADLAKLCDVFYIGGTKVGALCGEAIVFTHNNAPKHFMTQVKQHGALLAKGWILGIQFDTLFTDDLYMKISRHAVELADRMMDIFEKKGYEIFLRSPTNQQFITLDNERYAELSKQVAVSYWEKAGSDKTVVRFATSWSTSDEDLEALAEIL